MESEDAPIRLPMPFHEGFVPVALPIELTAGVGSQPVQEDAAGRL